jgi:hypothetical protein
LAVGVVPTGGLKWVRLVAAAFILLNIFSICTAMGSLDFFNPSGAVRSIPFSAISGSFRTCSGAVSSSLLHPEKPAKNKTVSNEIKTLLFMAMTI